MKCILPIFLVCNHTIGSFVEQNETLNVSINKTIHISNNPKILSLFGLKILRHEVPSTHFQHNLATPCETYCPPYIVS